MRKAIFWAFLGLCSLGHLHAQPGQLSLQTFAQGFTEPLYVTHAFDDRVFVVEKAGKIYILNQQGVRVPTPFLDIDPRVNSSASERGLLGLAFHPRYKQNGFFYVNYTNSAGATIVSRFSVTADSNVADPSSEQIMLTIAQPYSNHNGGCIQFGPDGYLYIGMGDGGSAGDPGNRSQNPQELLGKMLRIDVDNGLPYAIPADNPYVGSSTVREEIWAFGMRNPWRFSFDKVTGDLWIGDVGQNQWEEIDFWAAGDTAAPNFGWRCYEGNASYNTSGCQPQSSYDDPVYVYSHNDGCSVDGGYVYRGARYQSLWGYYFHTDYCDAYMWWTGPDGLGGWVTNRTAGTITSTSLVSFGEDYFGEVYLTGITNGRVYRLADTTCTPNAFIPGGDTVSLCQPGGWLTAIGGPSLSYQWQLGGSNISTADSAAIVATVDGDYRVIVSNGSCVDTSNTVHVRLVAAPTVTFSLPDTLYCDDEVPVAAIVSPAGGQLTGPGASGVFFDPSTAGVGTHVLTYAYTDPGTGCSASATFSVSVTVCVGVADGLQGSFTVAPNPSDGRFALGFDLPSPSEYLIELVDLKGQVVNGLQFGVAQGHVVRHLDFGYLAHGVYFLRLRAGESTAMRKVVIR